MATGIIIEGAQSVAKSKTHIFHQRLFFPSLTAERLANKFRKSLIIRIGTAANFS